jgi:hypothetical protein
MRRIILPSLASLAQPLFPHCLLNGTIFGAGKTEDKIVVWFSLELLSETFLILGIIIRDSITNVHTSFM